MPGASLPRQEAAACATHPMRPHKQCPIKRRGRPNSSRPSNRALHFLQTCYRAGFLFFGQGALGAFGFTSIMHPGEVSRLLLALDEVDLYPELALELLLYPGLVVAACTVWLIKARKAMNRIFFMLPPFIVVEHRTKTVPHNHATPRHPHPPRQRGQQRIQAIEVWLFGSTFASSYSPLHGRGRLYTGFVCT